MSRSATPVVFLDIDDVLCLSDPYGGYDAILAVNDRHPRPNKVYQHLFVERARLVMGRVHEEMQRRVRYVISSTWREHFDRNQMVSVLTQGGLSFVAQSLVEGEAWCTPSDVGLGRRADDIAGWLDSHHRGESFVT